LSQHRPDLATGLIKFYTQAEITKYLKEVAEYYQKEAEKYGDKLGGMLRTGPGDSAPKEEKKQEKADKKSDQKGKPSGGGGGGGGWVKMGSLMINTVNSGPATTEVMYQIHEDLKQKLARTNEALKSFEVNASTLIPQTGTFQLYVRNGVPERLIVEAEEAKKAVFNFDGKFRVV
jgi:hypothetical protein